MKFEGRVLDGVKGVHVRKLELHYPKPRKDATMTTQTVRPGSLDKLRAMRNDPPREAQAIPPDSPLSKLTLDLDGLEHQLEARTNSVHSQNP